MKRKQTHYVHRAGMPQVSTYRLYVLRATYLLLVVGLGLMVWPRLVSHSNTWAIRDGDAFGLLSGIQLMAIVGIRYPVKMLPLLLFELVWKVVWLVTIAVPLWLSNAVDAGTAESVRACGFGVIVCVIAIPWRFVWATFVKEPGDRWR